MDDHRSNGKETGLFHFLYMGLFVFFFLVAPAGAGTPPITLIKALIVDVSTTPARESGRPCFANDDVVETDALKLWYDKPAQL
ncbi:hypothetical protein ACFL6U_29780 [Planctomycetota bacterium]